MTKNYYFNQSFTSLYFNWLLMFLISEMSRYILIEYTFIFSTENI